jgi:hypothetical protein
MIKMWHSDDQLHLSFDLASFGVLVGTMAGWLPNVATVLTIVWVLIRILETDTIKETWRWLRNKR